MVIEEMHLETKSVMKQEYFSDNSVSLPGLMGQAGPVGFEPGMFKKDTKEHKTEPGSKVRNKT